MPELTDLAHFHFLRPLWLLALLILPLILLAARRITYQNSSWTQAIDTHLLKYLLQDRPTKRSRLPLWLLITAFAVAIIAQAGPTWEKIHQPVHKNEDALVIVMDLSLSMEATDIKPSRLVRARHKLLDILSSRTQGQTALIVFAGQAHIVSPLTDDTDTIAAMVPALSPLIMPALGSRLDAGIELAHALMKNAGVARGRILIISDGIEAGDVEPLAKLMNSSAHEFAMLTTGTEEGGPIPLPDRGFLKQQNQIVIVKTEQEFLTRLARETGMGLKSMQPDDSDFHALLDEPILNFDKKTRTLEREFDQWQEQGPWLLLLLTPLAALGFRRGWLLGVIMIMLVQPGKSWAYGWDDLWQKRDQQGQEAFNAGEHEKASQLFKDPLWKGSAHYRAGNYPAAAEDFAAVESAQGHYNRGNALAKAGQLDEAIKAYQQALEMDETLEDARSNKELVEQLKKQQEQQKEQEQEQQNQNEDSQNNSDNQQQDDSQQKQGSQQSDDPAQNKSQQEPSQQDSSQGQQNGDQEDPPSAQPESGPSQRDQKPENEQSQQDADKPQPDNNPAKQQAEEKAGQNEQAPSAASQQANSDTEQSEEDQAMEQWLRRIPDDPGGLLRRKFDYQYRQRRMENQFLPPNEDETLW